MPTIIQLKRGLNASLSSLNLLAGEPAFSTDTGKLYIGNGSSKILINPTLGSAASAELGTAAGEVPVLNANGKLVDSIIPKIAITDTFVVGTESEMTSLTAEVGDVAIRTDLSKSFILQSTPASTVSNWIELKSIVPQVNSVNGLTGAVVLNSANTNIGTGYALPGSASSIVVGDSLSVAIGKLEKGVSTSAPVASPVLTGAPKAPTPAVASNDTSIATTAFVKTAISSISSSVTSVNTLTGAVVLTGANVLATGYSKATAVSAIAATDSINQALGKLEKALEVIDGGTF